MAARTNKTTHDTKTKRLIAASQLLNRLIKHAKGEVEMTATQITAAKIVIGKSIPDLSAVEYTGEITVKSAHELTREELLSIAAGGSERAVIETGRETESDSIH